MLSRRRSIEAAMLSMPDQMEEIYQSIISAPSAGGLDSRLEESIARLRLEEDIEAELASDLGEALPSFGSRTAPTAVPVRPVPLRQGKTG